MWLGLVLEVPYQLALAISLALTPAAPHAEPAAKATLIATPLKATAGTADAQGPFGFTEQTWLKLVKQGGARHGLAVQAERIFVTSGGHYYAPVPTERDAILALRRNPLIAANLAGDNARDNLKWLAGQLGRTPTGGELYAAHRLGLQIALQLLKQARTTPAATAAPQFADAAAEARDLFYDGKRERTCLEISQELDRGYRQALARGKLVVAPAEVVSLGMLKTSEAAATVPLPERAKRTRRLPLSVAASTPLTSPAATNSGPVGP